MKVLERPPVVQTLKNFPEFYGTKMLITAFTRALHLFLYLPPTKPEHRINLEVSNEICTKRVDCDTKPMQTDY
jgi:hypothetical protein